MKFKGYKRADGQVGVRNYVLILPASICSSDTARMISQQVDGAVSFNNQLGCSQVPSDMQYTLDVLAGFAANPNVYATIIVALGCEACQCDLVESEIKKRTNKPLYSFIIQQEGGSIKLIKKAVKLAKELVREAALVKREEFPISELILATECGGSDPTSGIAANPLIGSLSDKIIEDGGTVILSETPEFIGAENILAARGKDEAVKQGILNIVERYEQHFIRNGENVRFGNPTPGNKEGGLTTLEEKSLGCIYKGGSHTVQAVYDYGKTISREQKGLVIMDTPGNDASSIAGMLAGGAQIVVFSTGRGTPLGSPLAPVIKVTGNDSTFKQMGDNIDFDASILISNPAAMEELTSNLYEMLITTCNGKETKAEELGFTETTIMRACNFV